MSPAGRSEAQLAQLELLAITEADSVGHKFSEFQQLPNLS